MKNDTKPREGPAQRCDGKDSGDGVSEWIKLKVGNDWGVCYWAIKPHDEHGMASASRGLYFRDGEHVDVRWPDGTVEQLTVRLMKKHGMVGDHGHDYEVSWQAPYVASNMHGHEALTPLEEVEVRRAWAESKQKRPVQPAKVNPFPHPSSLRPRKADSSLRFVST